MNLGVLLFLAAVTVIVLGMGYVLIRMYFSEKEAHVRRVLKQLDGDDNNG